MVGAALVAAALIVGYCTLPEKTTKHSQTLEPRPVGDPWTRSPWAAGFQRSAPATTSSTLNAKPDPHLSQSGTAASAAPIGGAVQTRADGAILNIATAQTGDNALNVKWPPLVSTPSSSSRRKPRGWWLNSTAYASAHCHLLADDSYARTGQYSALLQYDGADPTLRCIFGQATQAGEFSGTRVQFSAFLAGRDAVGGAGLILRADDAAGNIVAYNVLAPAAFKGSQPWAYDVIIVDVPATADKLYYGAWLGPGGGSLWIDTVKFHTVDGSFPVTHPPPAQSRNSGVRSFQAPLMPTNLDFEDTDPIP